MAICLYSNGILEECKPKNLVFTEEELVNIFKDCDEIKTARVTFILNTWCIYGKNIVNNDIDYNTIGSKIANEDIYTHVLFIHDSELNSKWNVTDILYKNYEEFIKNLSSLINQVNEQILSATDENDEEDIENKPQLISVGKTNDKRVIFEYNPYEQNEEFYKNSFNTFSNTTYEFVKNNNPKNEQFIIYANKQCIIYVEKNNIEKFLNTLIDNYKKTEEYENCLLLSNMVKSYKNPEKPKRRKKEKSKNNE